VCGKGGGRLGMREEGEGERIGWRDEGAQGGGIAGWVGGREMGGGGGRILMWE